jgi:hypothetical protein
MPDKFNLEDVFVTEGVPAYTFVPPPNYREILIDIRKPGKPVIIEGQTGTGKTTTIRQILKEVGAQATYLTARRPEDVQAIQRIAEAREKGFFVVDDFHRLSDSLRAELADIAKLAAEHETAADLPKLVIIGINQVGSDLIQLVPDIAKRTGIHRIQPGTKAEIGQIIAIGCEKLNIEFSNPDIIFDESSGDYWLTQQFCQSICTAAGVTATVDAHRAIDVDAPATRSRVIARLQAAYDPAVKEFCRGRRFRPSNDPYYKLLRTVGQQSSSVVDLNELANANPDVRGSINNIKDRRLAVLLDSKEQCKKYFYYNADTKNFAIEDPALFYYVKHLDWDRLRAECGFRDNPKSREFDVAISFAGENRALAKYIAEQLEFLDVHVFFDELYEDNYLGQAWGEQFKRIFSEDSEVVICLLDNYHLSKIWPTFERDCFVPRVRDAEVVPIMLDDALFPGIPADLVSIRFHWDAADPNWKARVDEEVVMRLIDRIG